MPKASAHACDIAVLVDEEVGASDARWTFCCGAWHHGMVCAASAGAAASQYPRRSFRHRDHADDRGAQSSKPELVFNLTEWVAGDRRLDSAIAGMLEMMRLRYTGAGPDGMQLARDKALAKTGGRRSGYRRGAARVVNVDCPTIESVAFPLIVKPQFGDGSDEIANGALVGTARELMRRVKAIHRRTRGPLMCEQFVAGRDLFVALLGNEPSVMPPLELVVGRQGGAHRVSPRRGSRTTPRTERDGACTIEEAKLAAEVAEQIVDASQRIFHALKLRDYARIDYRLTPDNRLVFLEANPNPDLTPPYVRSRPLLCRCQIFRAHLLDCALGAGAAGLLLQRAGLASIRVVDAACAVDR